MNLALVTGRGGSKRVPGKNTRLLAGRPLIAWSVEAALQASEVDRVLISTDDERIAKAARDAGGDAPFLRPAHLAGDKASHVGVIAHALDWWEHATGCLPEFLCLLQPTSPLRRADDIDALIGLVRSSGADCGISVAPVKVHPAYMYRLDGNSRATPLLRPRNTYQRSQDTGSLFYVNGAVYVLRPETFRARSTVLSSDVVAHVMPEDRSVDIDEEKDFALAEELMRARDALGGAASNE